ncbi:MAG: 3-dehydroquinate synthase [Candidatus Omnitrophica bacterium]|nr:3-dehydroquinate synthase [Candidatus Omnitrophota bacterium]
MRALQVRLKDRSYPIFVGRDILSRAADVLNKVKISQKHAIVVSQKEIAAHCQWRLTDALAKGGVEAAFFLTPAAKSSEAAKSQGTYFKLIKQLALLDGKGRSVFLIALGGGVIGDLTGFAAAVYRRGIPYIQIPTTLTAQVDSAIGGKTGIDLPEGKNLLGAIYQPRAVLSDTALLDTLPDRHWSDGFAEVIKYGVIRDARLFSILEKNGKEGIRKNHRLLEKVILRCARIKARIVSEDEWDKKDIRIVLNFGHTAGHAIEAASRFSREVTHGQAVAVGMLIASDIADSLGVLKDKTLTGRLEKTLLKFDLPLFYKGLSTEALFRAMGYDKKKTDSGKNRFVLPVTIGKTAVVSDVPTDVLTKALEKRRN